MRPHLENAARTASIDYVSIPGRYFHEQRGVFDHRLEEMWKVIFGGLDAGFELVRGFFPLVSIKLQRAHDGIVEEASNSLIPEKPERISEKKNSARLPRSPVNLQPTLTWYLILLSNGCTSRFLMTTPGFVEADLVAHSGPVARGAAVLVEPAGL